MPTAIRAGQQPFIQHAQATRTTPTAPSAPPAIYVVQPGDTFWGIATRTLGDGARWNEIWELNKDVVPNPDELAVGMALKIPGGEPAQPTPPTPAQPGFPGDDTLDPTPTQPAGPTPPPTQPGGTPGSLVANPDLAYVAAGGEIKRSNELVPGIDAVQRKLIQLGYPVNLGDNEKLAGLFGPGTEAQLMAFQRDHGLPATGSVTKATLLALDAAEPPVIKQPTFPSHQGIDEQGLQWVDKTRALQPPSYVPPDLVGVDARGRPGGTHFYVRGIAQPALQQMIADAARDGVSLNLVSAYRSYDTQAATYDYWVGQVGQAEADRCSARPGHSEHQLGLAFDFNVLSEAFGNTREGDWLAANAWKYGFVMSYPPGKESITGYKYEPWHYRYVGTEIAAEINAQGVSPQEYFQAHV